MKGEDLTRVGRRFDHPDLAKGRRLTDGCEVALLDCLLLAESLDELPLFDRLFGLRFLDGLFGSRSLGYRPAGRRGGFIV